MQGEFIMSSLTDNDVRLLDKTLTIREQLIDNLLKQELPSKPRDVECFTNLLESVDRSILAKAKIKIDEDSNNTNEKNHQLLKSLLLDLHSNPTPTSIVINTESRQTPEYKSLAMEISSGELIMHSDNIDVKTLLSNNAR